MKIKTIVFMLLTLAVFAIAGFMLMPSKAPFCDIVVFGDSLSDQGNVYLHTEKTFPQEPYYQGRFSNGPVWVERFAKKMGFPDLKPSLEGGTNFAYGGARTGKGFRKGRPNIGTQIDIYLEQNDGKINSKSLMVLWGGGNDFLWGNPLRTVTNIIEHVETLAKAGAKNFLVPNFPPFGYAPAFTHDIPVILEENIAQAVDTQLQNYFEDKLGTTIAGCLKGWVPTIRNYILTFKDYLPFFADEFANCMSQYMDEEPLENSVGNIAFDSANALAQMYNHHLCLALKDLEKNFKINIYHLDVHQQFINVIEDPDILGLSYIDKPALDPVTHQLMPGANPEEHLFFDGLHPASNTHELIAEEAFALVSRKKR